jgi:hypothetical protein
MRVLMDVRCPIEPFNSLVRNGKAGEIIGKILAELEPEAAYFTEHDGRRGAVLVVNLESASQIPAFAEPWFLNFNAECEFRIAMTPEDLQKAGLAELGKKWG